MADFNIAFDITKEFEGGYASVPGDRGGETYAGISRVYFPNWEGWKIVDINKPLKWNQKVNDPELWRVVKEFFKKNKWNKIKGDQINYQPLANLLYDYYVHSGVRAAKSLQKILNVTPDGVIGPNTLGAVEGKEEYTYDKLKLERKAFLTQLSKAKGQAQFRDGWLRRVNSF